MNVQELFQVGLAFAGILYGLYNHIHAHQLHQEIKNLAPIVYVIRVTVDPQGKLEPVATVSQEQDKPSTAPKNN
jgi:hypothetical protein